MASMAEIWTQLGSALGSLVCVWAVFQQYVPNNLRHPVEKYFHKLLPLFSPYLQITFPEFTGDEYLQRSEIFSAIQYYLAANSTATAKRLKADVIKDSKSSLVLSMDDYEEVTDDFNGVRVWWTSIKTMPTTQSFSIYPSSNERRFYKLTFHRRHRELITKSYINHVLKGGKEIAVKNRQRKLYSNNPSKTWHYYRQTKWSHVPFQHPATFDTLAMNAEKKEEIKNDLIKFSKSKEYYAKVGKAWKRGYLLYGPPGTGKSSMIAAIANFLDYDVYDVELTIVKDNTELRKLFIETSNKSVIVIEDIDCSLDLTGKRLIKKENQKDGDQEEEDKIKKKVKVDDEKKDSKVTLSGLLNFIDGLWSSCGEERIVVFTTNHVEKLDPALIRRGRMDMHIEMSSCCFEAFKVLATNYLNIDSHELYEEIKRLLEKIDMTPADVAENLMPKSDDDDEDTCLKKLIQALNKKAKEEEEERKMAEKEGEERSGEGEVKQVEENGDADDCVI